MKRNNIHIFGIPEREEKVIDSIFKAIMAENFLNLGREVNIQIREASKTSNRPTPRHIIIKMTKVKDKERILKSGREKQGTPIRLSADFLAETL